MKPLTPKQSLMVGLVSQGVSVAASAKKLKVNPRTARDWAARADFRAAVAAAREGVARDAADRLRSVLFRATRRLERLSASKDEAISLRATVELFNQHFRMSEHLDLAKQIADLKEAMALAESRDRYTSMGGRGE